MYTYDDYDYEDEVINESALDMAIDMSDRYGVAVEDAYDFALEKVDPDRVWLNTHGVRRKYSDPYTQKIRNSDANYNEHRQEARNMKATFNVDDETKRKVANAHSKAAYDESRIGQKLRSEKDEYFKRLRSAKHGS